MTEYTESSLAIREFMTSQDRVARWVQSYEDEELYSPSMPPSALDGWVPSSPVSEAESSYSLPPRMVLRYGNGLPDVPIPVSTESHRPGKSRHRHDDSRSSSTMSPTSPTSSNSRHRGRSGSHPSSPLAHSHSSHNSNHHPDPTTAVPEEIRVLPSNGPAVPRASSSNHYRSKSLPRSTEHTSYAPVPALPGAMPPRNRTPYPHPSSHGHAPSGGSHARHPLSITTHPTFTPEPWHTYTQGRPHHAPKPRPAIIYAPSPTSSRPRYAPPAIYNYPPQMGPNGMIYSHSAPVYSSNQYAPSGSLPSTMVPHGHTLAQAREEDHRAGTWSGRSNKYSRNPQSLPVVPPPPPLSPSSSSSSLESGNSGSTYYVLPMAGQKVHIISPSPEPSIATSTIRTPTTPNSFKNAPFFKRLFSFAGKFSHAGSFKAPSSINDSHGGRRLQRRHSDSMGRRSEVDGH